MLSSRRHNDVCRLHMLNNEKESVYLHNEPAPVRRLTKGHGLTSHLIDGAIIKENKVHEFAFDCLSHQNYVAAGDRTLVVLIH